MKAVVIVWSGGGRVQCLSEDQAKVIVCSICGVSRRRLETTAITTSDLAQSHADPDLQRNVVG
jgi:hypothetical protein